MDLTPLTSPELLSALAASTLDGRTELRAEVNRRAELGDALCMQEQRLHRGEYTVFERRRMGLV